MDVFDEAVEIAKRSPPRPLVLLVRDGNVEKAIEFEYTRNTKHVVFDLILPEIVLTERPERLILILPVTSKRRNEDGEWVKEDGHVVFETTGVDTKMVTILNGEVQEPDSYKFPLLEPVHEAMAKAWEGIC